jgi:hypothetical protein
LIPAILKASHYKVDFIEISKLESQANNRFEFNIKSQGFKSESIKTSILNISKQFFYDFNFFMAF